MSETESTPATYVGNRARTKTVRLEWPVAFNGKNYKAVTIARLSAAEVAEFMEQLKAAGGKELPLPIYRDADGEQLPIEVLDKLDDDDRFVLEEAAADFLPRRFRGSPASGSDPAPGDNIAPT